MFDEPEDPDADPIEKPSDPAQLAKEKADEFRVHAQLAAVFEGPRKFDAEILPNLEPDLAREIQKTIGRLEKSKSPESPLLPQPSIPDAARLLDIPATQNLSTNDYHIHRRLGEVMILRWLAGQQVDKFYERLQAHFDAGLNHFREEQRQAHEWKQDSQTLKFLDALDKIQMNLPQLYLRELIRTHKIYVLSTQSADEIDILHLCDYIMNTPAAEVVGSTSAPPPEPTEADRAWFFKLFALRGMKDEIEQMCFFTYLQKTDEESW